MNWLVRLGTLCFLLLLIGGCDAGGDVGKPCNLTQADNIKNLKALDTKARIVEASAACDLISFCFANQYDPDKDDPNCPNPPCPNQGKNELGYCSKECIPAQNDCPKGFTCDVFVKVQSLPDSHKAILAPLVGKNVCIKDPTTTPQP